MAEVINMPRLSDTMEEGTVAKWLKEVGDKVEEGDILAEIETDKATMEFESFYEGTLLHIGIDEGEGAPVDTLLAIIGEEGEDISSLLNGSDGGSGDDKDTSEDSSDEKDDKDGDDAGKSKDSADTDKDDSDTKNTSDTEDKDSSGSGDSGSDGGGSGEIPEGVEVINMPRLSDTMEEGTVATWLKQVGDKVEEGDILAEIETDKATMEFESFYSGTLLHIGIQEGESSPVDAVLAIIGPEGTDVDAVLKAKSDGGQSSDKKDTASEDGSSDNKDETKSGESKADSSSTSTEAKSESDKGESGSTSESDRSDSGSKAVHDGERIFASPLAKKIAEDKGIALEDVSGTGDNGRIVKKDIENFKPAAKTQSQPQEKSDAPAQEGASANEVAPIGLPVGEESSEEVKNSQMRKAIAKTLSKSKFTAPHYYLTIEVDMDDAMASRKRINDIPETKVSFNDLVVKACAMALRKHPQVNTTWSDAAMKYHKHIHVGVAVAVPDGLVVPVLQFADQMSLTQIGTSVKELAGKARNKKLSTEEMEGSTFTVSNLGMFGISEFTSIINPPNSAILSVGAIVEKPVVKNGEIVVGHTMKVTLACDHRTVDGATGSQFLATLRTYLENPVTMLA